MTDLRNRLMPKIIEHHHEGLDLGPGLVYPDYDGACLGNIPASLPVWLGLESRLPLQPLREEITNHLPGPYQNVILFLLDGLGLLNLDWLLERAAEFPTLGFWPQALEKGLLAPLTSIGLSTTSAALTSLWTAAAASQNGVLAYEMYLKEYGLTANMLRHSAAMFSGDVGGLVRAGFDPQKFLPVERLGEYLARYGAGTYAFQHATIANSGLSTMLLEGAQTVPFKNLSDLWVSLEALLKWRDGVPTYTYAYWSDLDELAHRYGAQDERLLLEFATFTTGFERFLRRLAGLQTGRSLVLVTADHGLIGTPVYPELNLQNHPMFLEQLAMLPSGEARVPILYVRPGHEDGVHAYVEQAWPGRFRLVNSQGALAAGLFGPLPATPRVGERLGDWLVVPQGDGYFWWDVRKPNTMLARHGGFSPEEMLIPLMAFEV
jgi:predicted AlkP superfamily pyrophosphatase or phosphodiesterase